MAKRQKEWARQAKAKLLQLLGGHCCKCGTTEQLTLDCIEPQGNEHHRMSFDSRVSFYRKQHFEFQNLQVLCHSCNSAKGDNTVDYRTVPELQIQVPNPY